jgi:hypothetical protein
MRQGESSITRDRDHLGGRACDVAVSVRYSDIEKRHRDCHANVTSDDITTLAMTTKNRVTARSLRRGSLDRFS